MTLPTFFFSHARADYGKYLGAFFRDLEERLAQWHGTVDIRVQRLGTIDRRIEHGGNWDKALSQGLAQNKCFVAIYSPSYFSRPNCGKELFVFLGRQPELDINSNGELTGIEGLLPIRWMPQECYVQHPEMSKRIPAFLGLVQDIPPDSSGDREVARAIDRYRRKGMESCVNKSGYRELIDLLVQSIISMRSPPQCDPDSVSFATARNAFEYDWVSHCGGSISPAQVSSQPPSPEEPQPFKSLAILYVGDYRISSGVQIINQLKPYPMRVVESDADREFERLVVGICEVGPEMGVEIFHGAIHMPDLECAVAELAEQQIPVGLVIDPDLLRPQAPGLVSTGSTPQEILARIRQQDRWTGVIMVPTFEGSHHVDSLGGATILPAERLEQKLVLRRAFQRAQEQLINATNFDDNPNVERMPLLKTGAMRGS